MLTTWITNNRTAKYLKQKLIKRGNDRKKCRVRPLKIRPYVKPNKKKTGKKNGQY